MLDYYAELTWSVSDSRQNVTDKLQVICQQVKKIAPTANRVSLWLFDEQLSEIFCLMCLDSNNQWSNGQSLKKEDFPQYFDYILKNNVLSASNAREHEATSCFNKLYFEPLNIYSLLDFIFHFQFIPTGIICCEREGNVIQWRDEEVAALKRVANITSMFFSEEVLSIQQGKEGVLNAIGRV